MCRGGSFIDDDNMEDHTYRARRIIFFSNMYTVARGRAHHELEDICIRTFAFDNAGTRKLAVE